MTAYILWTVFTWTVQGILCTCRFLWVSLCLVSCWVKIWIVHQWPVCADFQYMPRLFALQICPYNAIKFLPRQQQITEDTNRQLKQLIGKALIKYKLPNKAELKRPDFAGLNLRIRLVCSNAMNLKCEQVLLFFWLPLQWTGVDRVKCKPTTSFEIKGLSACPWAQTLSRNLDMANSFDRFWREGDCSHTW